MGCLNEGEGLRALLSGIEGARGHVKAVTVVVARHEVAHARLHLREKKRIVRKLAVRD